MQGRSWIALFERIPAKYQDSLALATTTGSEIMVQCLLRLEEDFVILRGRMAGTTDAARVVVVPYTQITTIAFTKRMMEPEVQAIFGDLMAAPVAAAPGGGAAERQPSSDTPRDGAEGVEEPVPEQTTPPEDANGAAAGKDAPKEKPKPISKSMLLARLRQRLAEQGHNLP